VEDGVPVDEAAAQGKWPWEADDPRIANAVARGYSHLGAVASGGGSAH
jgi:hypothetical protein